MSMNVFTLKKPDGAIATIAADSLKDAVTKINSMGYFFYEADCYGVRDIPALVWELHVPDTKTELYTRITVQ